MPAWHDIYALSENAKQDEAGIKEASLELGKFVDAEIKAGVPIGNTVIGGFSPGGSVALYNALTITLQYDGAVASSCWLPLHTKFMSSPTLLTMPKDVPVF
uniref:palmitoyl-protein hydrolase n=1 Tax=Schistosoma mansoni TaxID=6183 RepID=A0A5K4F7G7_SCHMA